MSKDKDTGVTSTEGAERVLVVGEAERVPVVEEAEHDPMVRTKKYDTDAALKTGSVNLQETADQLNRISFGKILKEQLNGNPEVKKATGKLGLDVNEIAEAISGMMGDSKDLPDQLITNPKREGSYDSKSFNHAGVSMLVHALSVDQSMAVLKGITESDMGVAEFYFPDLNITTKMLEFSTGRTRDSLGSISLDGLREVAEKVIEVNPTCSTQIGVFKKHGEKIKEKEASKG